MAKLQKKAIQSAIKKAGKKSDSPLFGQIIKLIPRHLLIKNPTNTARRIKPTIN